MKDRAPARILAGLLFLGLLAGVYFMDVAFDSVYGTELVLAIVVFLALEETYALFVAKGWSPSHAIGRSALVALFALSIAPTSWAPAKWLVLVGLVVALFATSTRLEAREHALDRFAATVGGFFYVVWLPSAAIDILRLPGVDPRVCLRAVYWVALVAKATDIGGYLVGKAIGRTKLAESVSPNKTVEGALAGLVFSVGASVGLARVFGLDTFTPLYAAIAGAILSVAAQVGDLFESLLKRSVGVKDSSAYSRLQVFGGFLDLLDSLVLALPVGLVLVQFRGL